MRHSGYVDQQSVRGIHRRPRTPALRPDCELFEESEISCRIARRSNDIGAQGSCICQHHAAPRARCHTGAVRRLDARTMCSIGNQDERLRIERTPLLAPVLPPAIHCHRRKPDREDAPRAGRTCHRRVHALSGGRRCLSPAVQLATVRSVRSLALVASRVFGVLFSSHSPGA